MPDCAKKKPNAMQEKTLHPGDTFTVPCDGCKNCCRNQRSYQFNLTGFDIYRMTKTIKMRPHDKDNQNETDGVCQEILRHVLRR